MEEVNYAIIDDEVRSRFPSLSDAEIFAFYQDQKDELEKLIRFDNVDLLLAKILRLFGYAGFREFLNFDEEKRAEYLRILSANEYIDAINDQRRDSVVMISAPEAQKRQLAHSRQNLGKEIARDIKQFRLEDL